VATQLVASRVVLSSTELVIGDQFFAELLVLFRIDEVQHVTSPHTPEASAIFTVPFSRARRHKQKLADMFATLRVRPCQSCTWRAPCRYASRQARAAITGSVCPHGVPHRSAPHGFGDGMHRVRFLKGLRDSSLLECPHRFSGTAYFLSNGYPWGGGESTPGVRRPAREADHLPHLVQTQNSGALPRLHHTPWCDVSSAGGRSVGIANSYALDDRETRLRVPSG
jgi:hypothetical protein